jgi:hypothetical protein
VWRTIGRYAAAGTSKQGLSFEWGDSHLFRSPSLLTHHLVTHTHTHTHTHTIGPGTHRALPLDLHALASADGGSTIVEQAAVGKRHSLLLTRQGRAFSCGSGLYHALGHGRTENEWTPRLVGALEGIGGMRAGGQWAQIAKSPGVQGVLWVFGAGNIWNDLGSIKSGRRWRRRREKLPLPFA